MFGSSISGGIYRNEKRMQWKNERNKISFFAFQYPNTINPVMSVYIKKKLGFFWVQNKRKKEIRIADACM